MFFFSKPVSQIRNHQLRFSCFKNNWGRLVWTWNWIHMRVFMWPPGSEHTSYHLTTGAVTWAAVTVSLIVPSVLTTHHSFLSAGSGFSWGPLLSFTMGEEMVWEELEWLLPFSSSTFLKGGAWSCTESIGRGSGHQSWTKGRGLAP